MIDHVSIEVRDLASAAKFYEPVLAAIGHKRLVTRPTTVGFGKGYPEFWLNERRAMTAVAPGSGLHICLRAPSTAAVDAFHAAALAGGAAPTARLGRVRNIRRVTMRRSYAIWMATVSKR